MTTRAATNQAARRVERRMQAPAMSVKKVLTIDIGGTNVKFLATGQTEPRKLPSGPKMSPAQMVEEVRNQTSDWKFKGSR